MSKLYIYIYIYIYIIQFIVNPNFFIPLFTFPHRRWLRDRIGISRWIFIIPNHKKNGPTLAVFQLYRNNEVISSKLNLLLFFSSKPFFFKEPNIKWCDCRLFHGFNLLGKELKCVNVQNKFRYLNFSFSQGIFFLLFQHNRMF